MPGKRSPSVLHPTRACTLVKSCAVVDIRVRALAPAGSGSLTIALAALFRGSSAGH